MMWWCAVVLCLLAVGTCSAAEESVLQKPEELVVNKVKSNVSQDFRQVWKKCSHKFSYRCVKLAVARLMDNLPPGLKIAPGITLMTNTSRFTEMADVLRSLVGAESKTSSEVHVLGQLKEFFNSLAVKIELEDPGLLLKVKTLSEAVVDELVNVKNVEGRKKGGGGALLWSAGALAAVGFASLAAVAGKAMMASLMALMLAGMSALRGGGGGGGGGGHKSSHVEIIKAPAHYELAPAHYEAGSHAFEHDHYYSAPAYEYVGRKMDASLPQTSTTDKSTSSS